MQAKDAMFLGWRAKGDQPARIEIVSRKAYLAAGLSIPCNFTLGAVFTKWKDIPDSQIMECVIWQGLEIVEHYDVPVKDVMRELEKIEGFIDHWNAVGRRTCSLF